MAAAAAQDVGRHRLHLLGRPHVAGETASSMPPPSQHASPGADIPRLQSDSTDIRACSRRQARRSATCTAAGCLAMQPTHLRIGHLSDEPLPKPLAMDGQKPAVVNPQAHERQHGLAVGTSRCTTTDRLDHVLHLRAHRQAVHTGMHTEAHVRKTAEGRTKRVLQLEIPTKTS